MLREHPAVLETPEPTLRVIGLGSAVIGLLVVWLARGSPGPNRNQASGYRQANPGCLIAERGMDGRIGVSWTRLALPLNRPKVRATFVGNLIFQES